MAGPCAGPAGKPAQFPATLQRLKRAATVTHRQPPYGQEDYTAGLPAQPGFAPHDPAQLAHRHTPGTRRPGGNTMA